MFQHAVPAWVLITLDCPHPALPLQGVFRGEDEWGDFTEVPSDELSIWALGFSPSTDLFMLVFAVLFVFTVIIHRWPCYLWFMYWWSSETELYWCHRAVCLKIFSSPLTWALLCFVVHWKAQWPSWTGYSETGKPNRWPELWLAICKTYTNQKYTKEVLHN